MNKPKRTPLIDILGPLDEDTARFLATLMKLTPTGPVRRVTTTQRRADAA